MLVSNIPGIVYMSGETSSNINFCHIGRQKFHFGMNTNNLMLIVHFTSAYTSGEISINASILYKWRVKVSSYFMLSWNAFRFICMHSNVEIDQWPVIHFRFEFVYTSFSRFLKNYNMSYGITAVDCIGTITILLQSKIWNSLIVIKVTAEVYYLHVDNIVLVTTANMKASDNLVWTRLVFWQTIPRWHNVKDDYIKIFFRNLVCLLLSCRLQWPGPTLTSTKKPEINNTCLFVTMTTAQLTIDLTNCSKNTQTSQTTMNQCIV